MPSSGGCQILTKEIDSTPFDLVAIGGAGVLIASAAEDLVDMTFVTYATIGSVNDLSDSHGVLAGLLQLF